MNKSKLNWSTKTIQDLRMEFFMSIENNAHTQPFSKLQVSQLHC